MYHKESFLKFLDEWSSIAEDQQVSRAELAYRWINHHSMLKREFGDAIVFGATKLTQMAQTCRYLQAGPLSDQAVQRIEALWATVKDESILDHFQATLDTPI